MGKIKSQFEVHAIKVTQWLENWECVKFNVKLHRRKPEPHFYLVSLSANLLKRLSGIYRRSTASGRRRLDLGIQRRHDKGRSDRIHQFVQYGYPWSELGEAKRKSGEYEDLLKPGWLPTAIVVNILAKNDTRGGQRVSNDDLINIVEANGEVRMKLPQGVNSKTWLPSGLFPIEVIDGQHRLWAFEEQIEGQYDLPVVAFHGLDISWQAYLFWSINITPKRINASLAFDLYPLLRTEDWLEKFEGHSVYRETRAQELTEALWSMPDSPWYQRINMLGESGLEFKMVTQASWIRSLMATFIKGWEVRKGKLGGLFGARLGEHKQVLPWARVQQAAFLIFAGKKFRMAVESSDQEWISSLRSSDVKKSDSADPGFYGSHTLINTDQGIRGLLYIINDFCFVKSTELKLNEWTLEEESEDIEEGTIKQVLSSLGKQPVDDFLDRIAGSLAQYDWRSSSAPDLSEQERTIKLGFRGSGGYRELRRQLLLHLSGEAGEIGSTAKSILAKLNHASSKSK